MYISCNEGSYFARVCSNDILECFLNCQFVLELMHVDHLVCSVLFSSLSTQGASIWTTLSAWVTNSGQPGNLLKFLNMICYKILTFPTLFDNSTLSYEV